MHRAHDQAAAEAGPDPARAGGRARAAAGERARRRAPARHRAPRHQARQPVRVSLGAAEGARLRPRQALGAGARLDAARRGHRRTARGAVARARGGDRADAPGDGARDRGLHVAGAGARPAGRLALGPVLARSRALRGGDRRARVPGHDPRRRLRSDPEPGTATCPPDRSADPGRARGGARPPARQGAGAALPDRRRADRRPDAGRARPGGARPQELDVGDRQPADDSRLAGGARAQLVLGGLRPGAAAGGRDDGVRARPAATAALRAGRGAAGRLREQDGRARVRRHAGARARGAAQPVAVPQHRRRRPRARHAAAHGARCERAAQPRAGPRGVPAARDARDGARLDLAAGRALRVAARSDRVRVGCLDRAGAGGDAARRGGARDARRDGLAAAHPGGGVDQVRAGLRRAGGAGDDALARGAARVHAGPRAAPPRRRGRGDPVPGARAPARPGLRGGRDHAVHRLRQPRRSLEERAVRAPRLREPREGQRARAAVHHLPVPRPRDRRHAGGGGRAQRVEADLPQRLRAGQRAGAALQPARALRPRRRGGERGAHADPRPPVRALEPGLCLSGSGPRRGSEAGRGAGRGTRGRHGPDAAPALPGRGARGRRGGGAASARLGRGQPARVRSGGRAGAGGGLRGQAAARERALPGDARARGPARSAGSRPVLRRARRDGARTLRRSRHRAGAGARRAVSRPQRRCRRRAAAAASHDGARVAGSARGRVARPRGGRGASPVDAGRLRAAADDARRDRALAREAGAGDRAAARGRRLRDGYRRRADPDLPARAGRAGAASGGGGAPGVRADPGAPRRRPVLSGLRAGAARRGAGARRERRARAGRRGVPRVPRRLVGRRCRSARAARGAPARPPGCPAPSPDAIVRRMPAAPPAERRE